MHSDFPWYGYLALLAFYMIYEAIYRACAGYFFATHMISELLEVIEKLKKEIESDTDGARVCAWVVTIVLIAATLLLVGVSIVSLVKLDSAKDVILSICLVACLLPFTLFLSFINEVYMSWVKKVRN